MRSRAQRAAAVGGSVPRSASVLAGVGQAEGRCPPLVLVLLLLCCWCCSSWCCSSSAEVVQRPLRRVVLRAVHLASSNSNDAHGGGAVFFTVFFTFAVSVAPPISFGPAQTPHRGGDDGRVAAQPAQPPAAAPRMFIALRSTLRFVLLPWTRWTTEGVQAGHRRVGHDGDGRHRPYRSTAHRCIHSFIPGTRRGWTAPTRP